MADMYRPYQNIAPYVGTVGAYFLYTRGAFTRNEIQPATDVSTGVIWC